MNTTEQPVTADDLVYGAIKPTQLEAATERGFVTAQDLEPELLRCR